MSRWVCTLIIGLAGVLIMTALLSTPGHQGLVAAPTLSFPSARMAPEASAVGIGVRAAEKGGPIDWVGIYAKIRRWKAQDREVALDHVKDNKAVDYSNEGRFWWQSSNTKRLQ